MARYGCSVPWGKIKPSLVKEASAFIGHSEKMVLGNIHAVQVPMLTW